MNFDFEADGFAILQQVIPPDLVESLRAEFRSSAVDRSQRGAHMFGARNVLDLASVSALGHLGMVHDFVSRALGKDAAIVRGIFFDKTPGANWPVAWHQDLTLALSQRADCAGWCAWSLKAGVTHAQPPPEILT